MTRIEKALIVLAVVLWGTVAVAQIYKAGERHGFEACQEQF
jgi:hypothetical protein